MVFCNENGDPLLDPDNFRCRFVASRAGQKWMSFLLDGSGGQLFPYASETVIQRPVYVKDQIGHSSFKSPSTSMWILIAMPGGNKLQLDRHDGLVKVRFEGETATQAQPT